VTAFDDHAVADELRDRLWRYLSSHAVVAGGVRGRTLALTGLDANELDRLLAAHLGISALTADLLADTETLLKRLQARNGTERRQLSGWVEGDVDWERTNQERLDTGDPTLFSCSPAVRMYDSPSTRALVAALKHCSELPQRARLGQGPVGDVLRSRAELAVKRRAHVKIRDVPSARNISEHRLDRMSRNAGWLSVANYLRWAEHGLDSHDPTVVRELLERTVLRPKEQDKLFELLVGFRVVECLETAGYAQQSLQAVIGSRNAFAVLEGPLGRVEVWRQRSLTALTPPVAPSRYAQARMDNGMTSSSLLPDWIVHFVQLDLFVPIEVKLYEDAPAAAIRAGVIELFAYLHDRHDLFSSPIRTMSLLVAWDAPGRPASNGPVIIASQDSLSAAVAALLARVTLLATKPPV
jgi:hypothetical protein